MTKKLYEETANWQVISIALNKIVETVVRLEWEKEVDIYDSVLWQNPLYQQKIKKPKDKTQTPPKTSITYNDCEPN